MDKIDELLARADKLAEELKYNEIVLETALEDARQLQIELLIEEIERYNEESI